MSPTYGTEIVKLELLMNFCLKLLYLGNLTSTTCSTKHEVLLFNLNWSVVLTLDLYSLSNQHILTHLPPQRFFSE